MVNRRTFLITGAATGGLAAAGGAGFILQDRYRGWLREILQRWLPGHDIDAEGFARFVEDYYIKQGHSIKLRTFAAAEGLVNAKALLPEDRAVKIEEEKRRAFTAFLIGSDFFDHYPNGPKKITYHGVPACTNPFATF